MNGTGDNHIKWSKPSSEKQKWHVFSHMWKIDPKTEGIHKHMYDHMNIYTEITFVYTYVCICMWLYLCVYVYGSSL
jgi:hypothetical protein